MNSVIADTLTADRVTKTFPGVTALAGIDLAIPLGQLVAVMGPSGSGKSTFLHCLSGVLLPDSGQVSLGWQSISDLSDRARSRLRRVQFGFVFQNGQLVDELTVRENVALPLLLLGVQRRAALAAADSWCARLGIGAATNRLPGELSGGQIQRAAIARALVHDPAVVFADEPTGALDQASGHEVMQIMTAAVRQTGASLVLVTHDQNVASWCERLVEIRDGLVFADSLLTPPLTSPLPSPLRPPKNPILTCPALPEVTP